VAGIEYRLGLRERSRLIRTLRAALVWLAVCTLGGLLIALMWGEFGSIVAVGLGAILGACGASASCAASALQHYRLLKDRHVGAAVWLIAMTLFGGLELVWRWTIKDAALVTPIVGAVAVPLSYMVGRIYSVQTGVDRPASSRT
jgi:hypothetical protein